MFDSGNVRATDENRNLLLGVASTLLGVDCQHQKRSHGIAQSQWRTIIPSPFACYVRMAPCACTGASMRKTTTVRLVLVRCRVGLLESAGYQAGSEQLVFCHFRHHEQLPECGTATASAQRRMISSAAAASMVPNLSGRLWFDFCIDVTCRCSLAFVT